VLPLRSAQYAEADYPGTYEDELRDAVFSINDISNLNHLFKALRRDDLGLKKFAPAISKVNVMRKGTGGIVLFKPSSAHKCATIGCFDGSERKEDMKEEYRATCLSFSRLFVLFSDHSLSFEEADPPTPLKLPKTLRDRTSER